LHNGKEGQRNSQDNKAREIQSVPKLPIYTTLDGSVDRTEPIVIPKGKDNKTIEQRQQRVWELIWNKEWVMGK
jgi:hypothetical protein